MSKSSFVQEIVQAIKSVLPTSEFISLHEPVFQGNEWLYVKECLDTGWVSSVGKYVDLFEQKLAEFTGSPYAVATVNGTAALHICLKLVGVEQGDEVLIPSLTFVATANAVAYCGAVPHFVESNEVNLGIDVPLLNAYLDEFADVRDNHCFNRQTQRPIKALVPMHTFGHPSDLDALTELAAKFKLVLVEDAAESLGSFYKGRHTGNWGKVSSLSFNGNKIITTGGGGAILTSDPLLAKLAKHLTTTAKVPHRWEYFHDQSGYNYRLPNLNSALGCAQLEQLPSFLDKKRKLAELYEVAFSNIPGVHFVREPVNTRSNYWLNAILLEPDYASQRDSILAATNDIGIMTRPAWTLLHKLPMYQSCPKMRLSVAESIEQRLINIPSSSHLIDSIER
ncbi:MAG: LegC family aminotransferase [SAR324 cluster bacterium]|nr:LegC family aminotransferase [SAR324 cluster bacterium]